MKSKILLVALLMLSLAFARQEIPYVYEEEDFGNDELPRFLYSLSVDCETGVIRQEVFNEEVEPVPDVSSYLKYHDYATPLISSGETDASGLVIHEVPAGIDFMTGLFILVIEEPGYMSKEIHFSMDPCLEEDPPPEPEVPDEVPPEPPVTPPVEEPPVTPPPEEPPVAPPAEELPAPEENETPEGNDTAKPSQPPESPQACPVGAALVLLSGLLVFRARA